ncbi:uncharacterized protein LOC111379447 [Olea europaea var. sylvestris]|uniref:uncharacterized protein LOC111379447 n=1 Tax=Olea europaea var. sylvestris TaxID=158386 RepID=UPI000C1D38DB|nr:uncharacterized protein LOC111379447 [Olea europaea var. sylvestris]
MYTNSQDQVAREFVQFYTNLLGKSKPVRLIELDIISNGPLISLEQGNSLIRDISSEEIKRSTHWLSWNSSHQDTSSNKSTTLSLLWCQSQVTYLALEIIGLYLVVMISTKSSGYILKQINYTVIALMPKSSHAPSIGDYRPISCCNAIYKVIIKILASRLRLILGNIVDHAQATFVEGRIMMENIHLTQELMRQYNRKKIAPRYLLKIDLRKAYYSISWDFLKGFLEHFPSRFIQMVRAAINDSEYNYHPNCGPLKITHLGFMDDFILFAREDFMY